MYWWGWDENGECYPIQNNHEMSFAWATPYKLLPRTNNHAQMADATTQATQEDHSASSSEGKVKRARKPRAPKEPKEKVAKVKTEPAVVHQLEDGIKIYMGPHKGVYKLKETKSGKTRKIYLDPENFKPKKSNKRKSTDDAATDGQGDDGVHDTAGVQGAPDLVSDNDANQDGLETETKVTIKQRPRKRRR